MKYQSLALLALVIAITVIVGCGSTEKAAPNAQNKSHKHDSSGGGATDMEKMKAELAKLSPDDAKAAEKQHVCLGQWRDAGNDGGPKEG